jgi:hypothetical protein
MRKNAVVYKSSAIRLQPTPYGAAILSRKGRKLWAGAPVLEDEAPRMRCDSPCACYETLPEDSSSAHTPEESDNLSGRFEVKPDPQTVE